jgi:hypothetical protein
VAFEESVQFRAADGELSHFLLAMEQESSYKWTGSKPIHMSSNRELLCEIAEGSPIVHFILKASRDLVVVLRRKLLIWSEYHDPTPVIESTLAVATFLPAFPKAIRKLPLLEG